MATKTRKSSNSSKKSQADMRKELESKRILLTSLHREVRVLENDLQDYDQPDDKTLQSLIKEAKLLIKGEKIQVEWKKYGLAFTVPLRWDGVHFSSDPAMIGYEDMSIEPIDKENKLASKIANFISEQIYLGEIENDGTIKDEDILLGFIYRSKGYNDFTTRIEAFDHKIEKLQEQYKGFEFEDIVHLIYS